jgi:hypothetical protein
MTALTQRVEKLITSAETLGIEIALTIGTITSDEEEIQEIISKDAHSVQVAASINKLAIAAWVIQNTPEEKMKDQITWTADEKRIGGGRYDQDDSGQEGSIQELLNDMLQNSGNTAAAILGRNHSEEINIMLQTMEFPSTALIPQPDGKFLTGNTSAKDSMTLMRLLVQNQSDSLIGDIAKDALSKSKTPAKKLYVPYKENGVGHHYSKVGALNKDDDIPAFIRNDVGLLDNHQEGQILYSIFTRSSTSYEAKVAEEIIASICAALAESLSMVELRLAPTLLPKT